MRIKVDHAADAVYLNLTDRPIKDSEEVADGIVVDYDDEGRIVGIEILDASKRTADPSALKIQLRGGLVGRAPGPACRRLQGVLPEDWGGNSTDLPGDFGEYRVGTALRAFAHPTLAPGMEDMSRGLDFEKAQAAFKRAADKATRGTREERSGRFEPVVQRRSSSYAGARGKSEISVMSTKKHELYVERRSQGDYAVRRGGAERASVTAPTQKAAIGKAEKLDPKAAVLVERVRDTNAGGRDKWRKS